MIDTGDNFRDLGVAKFNSDTPDFIWKMTDKLVLN